MKYVIVGRVLQPTIEHTHTSVKQPTSNFNISIFRYKHRSYVYDYVSVYGYLYVCVNKKKMNKWASTAVICPISPSPL